MSAIPGGSLTDGSGAIAAGGTSEEVFAENVSRQYLFLQNLHATEALWVNFGTAAVADQPSIRVDAGATLLFSGAVSGVVPTATVNVLGPTTGNKYVAKEG